MTIAHPLPELPRRGWAHLPELPLDGLHWPLAFAADLLDIDVKKLRKLVKDAGLEPSGTANMASFRRSGRQPRVYPAQDLIALHEQHCVLRSRDNRVSGCGRVMRHDQMLTGLWGIPARARTPARDSAAANRCRTSPRGTRHRLRPRPPYTRRSHRR
jgi:hypothetical protein